MPTSQHDLIKTQAGGRPLLRKQGGQHPKKCSMHGCPLSNTHTNTTYVLTPHVNLLISTRERAGSRSPVLARGKGLKAGSGEAHTLERTGLVRTRKEPEPVGPLEVLCSAGCTAL